MKSQYIIYAFKTPKREKALKFAFDVNKYSAPLEATVTFDSGAIQHCSMENASRFDDHNLALDFVLRINRTMPAFKPDDLGVLPVRAESPAEV